MPIGEVCVRQVVIGSIDTPVLEGAKLMRQHHAGNIVVTNNLDGHRTPLGIVTDRDLVLEVMAEDLDPKKLTLGEIMSTDLITVAESQGIYQTVQLMRAKGVRRAPVVDDKGGLVGIIAVDDLLQLLAEELSELAKLVTKEQKRESELRR
jgi:CBS domain-containing protein